MKKIFLSLLATASITLQAIEPSDCPDQSSIFVEALYWHLSESAEWSSELSIEGQKENISYNIIKFDWDPGVRVGLQHKFDCAPWDARFSYTWFSTQAKDNAEGDVISSFLGSKVAEYSHYTHGDVKWSFDFNMLDFDLGRPFAVDSRLLLHPFMGIKGGWISQTIDTRLFDPIVLGIRVPLEAKNILKNNFQGCGPKLGIDMKWIFNDCHNCKFSLIGSFAGSYLWGHWSLNDSFEGGITSVSVRNGNRHFGSFVLQGLLGVAADWSICRGRFKLTTSLTYELQDWFNQYQLIDNTTGGHNNDLVLQGVALKFNLGF